MRNLTGISISFTTQGSTFVSFQFPPPNPRVHVFIKNRRSDTSLTEADTDFISNLFAWRAAEAAPPAGINPYLGCALNLGGIALIGAVGTAVDIPIPLRTQPILAGEVILPVVNIHLYSATYGTWAFNYTITFEFDDGSYSYSPAEIGIPSILLDSNNPNYSGICREANPWPAPVRPAAEPCYLRSVRLDFGTHGDDKADDTRVGVHIVNRLNATSYQDMVIAHDIFAGEGFPQPTSAGLFTNLKNFGGDKTIVFGQGGSLPLASEKIELQEIVLPVVYLTVAPTGGDRWIFDYRVTYAFSNGMEFSSRTNNVSLGQGSNKHQGVYNGPALPTYAPPGPTSAYWTPKAVHRDKTISLSWVQAKLDELANHRANPLFKFRFGSLLDFGDQRESYYDLQAIVPDPPPSGTLSVPDYTEPVTYRSGLTSLGFLDHGAYFNSNVDDESIALTIDASSPLPVTALLTFKTPFDVSYTVGPFGRTMAVKEFWIRLKFTLAFDSSNKKVDLLRWVYDINHLTWTTIPGSFPLQYRYTGEFLGQQIEGTTFAPTAVVDSLVEEALVVRFTTTSWSDFGAEFRKGMRDQVFKRLSTPSPITEKSPADRINDYVNAWLLGGVVHGGNRCRVSDVHIDGDVLHISYTGPTYEPTPPPNWPTGDFSPGPLANIEHIVVLTKENRSFDSMLGYLSLPVDAGGQGRADVDGLKGGGFNMLDGTQCPSFAFEPEDTIFSPNPPQDSQRTLRQIDNGKMDGFVEAFADQDGLKWPRGSWAITTPPMCPCSTRLVATSRSAIAGLPRIRSDVPKPLLRAHRQAQ